MSKKKKKYYPNNWKAIKDAPHEFFESIPYEQFMDWKLLGWELPSSVAMVIREQDMETGKVKEWVYERIGNADKRCKQIMKQGRSEFIVCTHDDLVHMFPKELEDEELPF